MFEFLESLLYELKDIPGLSFLRKVHFDLKEKSSKARRKIQEMRNKQNHYSGVSGRLGKSAKGSKLRKD